jgi:hypothetical protein
MTGHRYNVHIDFVIQDVPLATEPCISVIILTPMKILQRNLNRGTFVVSGRKWWPLPAHVMMSSHFLHSEVSPLQMPGSVARGTHCII